MPLTANASGTIEGTITIPENIPSGTKLVVFAGDQGSYGETTYTGRGLITTEERRATTTSRRRLSRIDPIAKEQRVGRIICIAPSCFHLFCRITISKIPRSFSIC